MPGVSSCSSMGLEIVFACCICWHSPVTPLPSISESTTEGSPALAHLLSKSFLSPSSASSPLTSSYFWLPYTPPLFGEASKTSLCTFPALLPSRMYDLAIMPHMLCAIMVTLSELEHCLAFSIILEKVSRKVRLASVDLRLE